MNSEEIILNKTDLKEKEKETENENIVVNLKCSCNKYFYNNENLIFTLPCCHIIHEKCMNNFLIRNKNKHFKLKCPFCKNRVDNIITEKMSKQNKKYKQISIDMKSVKMCDDADINYLYMPMAIIKFTSITNKLLSVTSSDELDNFASLAINSFNIKIKIHNNLKNNKLINKDNTLSIDKCDKIVYISNHSHYLDSLIMRHLFKCGFIASDFINQSDIGKMLVEACDLLIFKRGVDTNVVDKIKGYLDDKKKIAIFPEGATGNNETLLNFRTGAFHTNSPICPIIIKYNPFVYDNDMNQMILKILTHEVINVDVYINDLFYPPFNTEKIEQVRDVMATVGNLQKSRVSNRLVKD
jgi:1-acyl-sn-glycerol-3-phosphate acyltransferase